MERKTGFEPATATLARWSSTGLSYFRSSMFGANLRILNPSLGGVKPPGLRDGRVPSPAPW